MRKLLSILTVTALVACGGQASSELTEDDRAAIRQLYDELALTLTPEDNRAWANLYTEDAQFMVPNQPTLRGRESLYEWGAGDNSGVVLSISFSDIEIQGSGDLAWVTLNRVLTIEGVEGPIPGKGLAVLQRQADGTWLFAAASGSDDQPPGN